MNKLCESFNIKGFKEASLLEWEGKLASILFLPDCNFRCPFCHSRSLVVEYDSLETIPFSKIEAFLKKKKGWIDGVAITGGEPTLHNWLFDLIDTLKGLSLLVMIETNGSRPEVIKGLLETKRLDKIAMDIKAPLNGDDDKYRRASGVSVDLDKIRESAKIILSSGIDSEFRTTVVPGIHTRDDIVEIAKSIRQAKRYCLQGFVPHNTLDPAYLKLTPYSEEKMNEMAALASQYVKDVVVRKN